MLDNEIKYPTRIEFIFDLIANKSNLEINNLQKDDERRSYYIFNELIKDNDTAKNCWNEVKRYFRVFNEFYSNQEYYHLVGFLVHNGIRIEEIIKDFTNINKQYITSDFPSALKEGSASYKGLVRRNHVREDVSLNVVEFDLE